MLGCNIPTRKSAAQNTILLIIMLPQVTYLMLAYRGLLLEWRRYSAASILGSAFSTFAAQNLNSGILPKGSSFGLVKRFAAAST